MLNRLKMIAAVLCLVALAAVLSATIAAVPGSARAQVPAPENTAGAASSVTHAFLTTDELAAFDAYGRGDWQTAYALLLPLVTGLPNDALSPERDRAAGLTAVIGQVVARGNLAKTAAADLKDAVNPAALGYRYQLSTSTAFDPKAAEQCEAMLGCITGWLVCGPFDNERGAGFGTGYLNGDGAADGDKPALPSFDTVYAGKASHKVSWRPVPVAGRIGMVDVDALVRPNDQACVYAFATVEAGAACTVTLGFTGDDGFRVWLNGVELAARGLSGDGKSVVETAGRNIRRSGNAVDQDAWRVMLNKGVNTLMVKSCDEEGAWQFGARIRADDGTVLTRSTPAQRPTWETRIPAAYPAPAGEAAQPHIVAVPENARALFWRGLAELATHNSETKDKLALHLFERARAIAAEAEGGSETTHLNYWMSEAARSTAETSAGVDENERRKLLLAVIKRDARYVPALLAIARHYTERLDIPSTAAEYAQRVLALLPACADARLLLARSYARRGMNAEYERACRMLADNGAATGEVMRYIGYFEENSGNAAAAMTAYRAALAADGGDSFARTKIEDAAVRDGKIDDFLTSSRAAASLSPFDTGVLQRRATVLANHGREGDALTVTQSALDLSPHNDGLLKSAADLSVRVADSYTRKQQDDGLKTVDGVAVETLVTKLRAQAVTYCRTAVDFNPTRADLRRYIEFLSDETPVWEKRLQLDIGASIRTAQNRTDPTDAMARYVWIDQIIQVNTDGTASHFLHIALKITNEDGRQAFAQFPAQLGAGQSKVVSARVHRADGTIVNSRVDSGSIQNPPLAIGDVFELRARVFDTEKGFFGDFFGDITTMDGLGGFAADGFRAVYVLPLARQFYFHTRNSVPEPTSREEDGHRVVIYSKQNLPRVEDEPLAPSTDQTLPTIYCSTFADWNTFGSWYWNLIQRQVKPTPAISAQVKELTAGLGTEQAKVRAIYHWVVTKIRYNDSWEFGVHGYKPYEAGAILDRCIGDCKDKAILIVTMLREAGIAAFPVLIKGEEFRGNEDITLPMPEHFNHAIAYVEFKDGTKRFIDGTATYVAYDEGVPQMDGGAHVIVVKPEGGEVAQVPAPMADACRDNWKFTLKLDATGTASLDARNDPTGQMASYYRQQLETEGGRKTFLEQQLAEIAVGASVADVKTSELLKLEQPVWFSFAAKLPGLGLVEEGKVSIDPFFNLFLQHPWGQTGIASIANRKQPLVLPAQGFPALGAESAEITVLAPNGYELDRLPDAVEIDNDWMRLSVKSEKTEGGAKITRSWCFKATFVPAKEYPAFRAALLKVDEANAAKVTFKKKAG
jgi:tetratricopeptide (TPR) repeat protein